MIGGLTNKGLTRVGRINAHPRDGTEGDIVLSQLLIAAAIATVCIAHLLADWVRMRVTRHRPHSWVSRSIIGERPKAGSPTR